MVSHATCRPLREQQCLCGGQFLIKIEAFFFSSSSTLKATVGSFNHRVVLSFLKEEERHFNFKLRGLK